MQFAVIHRVSMNMLARYDATDVFDVQRQWVNTHPEYGCDSWDEFATNYPVLSMSLLAAPIQ
jgi:hypothetical protein